jgi:hypothetical protein
VKSHRVRPEGGDPLVGRVEHRACGSLERAEEDRGRASSKSSWRLALTSDDHQPKKKDVSSLLTMRRKVPSSTKQKRQKLQAARHEARAGHDPSLEAQPPPHSPAKSTQPRARGPKPARLLTPEEAARRQARQKASSLESRFLKLPKDLVQRLRLAASELPLTRPVDTSLSVWPVQEDVSLGLSCPKRPKWHYTSTKNEVEKVLLFASLLIVWSEQNVQE